jgi:hypothetical protein
MYGRCRHAICHLFRQVQLTNPADRLPVRLDNRQHGYRFPYLLAKSEDEELRLSKQRRPAGEKDHARLDARVKLS